MAREAFHRPATASPHERVKVSAPLGTTACRAQVTAAARHGTVDPNVAVGINIE